MPSTPNPNLPSSFDPETYSAFQPGTHPHAFDQPHNAPKRASSSGGLDANLALPRWAIVLLICVPLALTCLTITIVYLARNRRTNMQRLPSPLELLGLESRSHLPPDSLPELYWPNPQRPPPIHNPASVVGEEDEWEDMTTANNSFAHAFAAHHRDRRARAAVNDAFAQHRRRRLQAAAHLADGADTDVIAASDTYSMGPQSSTEASRRVGGERFGRAVSPLDRAVSPLEGGAVFPSEWEEMSAFAETELSDDPFGGEVKGGRERERR